MKYLRKFNESIRLERKYPGKYISTNPWYYVDSEDIVVIMTGITDFFYHHSEIKESEEVVNNSMVRRIVRADYWLTIPDNEMNKFKSLIKQSEWRLLRLVPGTPHGKLTKNTQYYLKDQYGDNLQGPLYHYQVIFKDCKLKRE